MLHPYFKRNKLKCLSAVLGLTTLFMTYTSQAQQAEPLPLYTGKIPGSKPTPADYTETVNKENGHITRVSQPTLLPFFPEKGKANGTAIIICPGGAYGMLSYDKEGMAVARKFAEAGVTAFVLKYRLPSDKIMEHRETGPLQDAQRAFVLVRENAAKWGVNPARVGIIGFSAGGHLAATATTMYDKPVTTTNGLSVKPDFSVLVYPVISMGQYTHQGSKENLIGGTAPADVVKAFSTELRVKADCPPVCLIHAQDDTAVPPQNSLLFYNAMLEQNIKGAMYLYQTGGHGYGLNNKTTADQWFDRVIQWMALNKFM